MERVFQVINRSQIKVETRSQKHFFSLKMHFSRFGLPYNAVKGLPKTTTNIGGFPPMVDVLNVMNHIMYSVLRQLYLVKCHLIQFVITKK